MMPKKQEDLDGINNNNNNNIIDNNNTNNNLNNDINSFNNNNEDSSTSTYYGNNEFENINNNNNSNGNSKMQQNTTGLSKAELRKSNKPIMEKRRRARINHCLNELKTLILEAMKKDPARHTKLEKADILEMTVKHLQSIQRQQLSLAIQTDPTVIHKFKSGFTECAEEVNRYISQLEGIDVTVRQRLANHLNNCSTGLEQLGTFSNFSNAYRPSTSTIAAPYNVTHPSVFPLPQDVNNNGRIQMGGVQLIPSRLPSGEIALIMPNSNNVPFFLPNIQPHSFDTFTNTFSRMSAFSKPSSSSTACSNVGSGRPTTATQTKTTTTTPPLSPVSSVSSAGDDSMHTSSDFQTKTPPPSLDQSFSGIFPTPPSADNSIKFVSHIGNLQQPHVSSTSETQNYNKSEAESVGMQTTARKRRSSSDSGGEPCSKSIKRETFEDPNGNSTTATTNETGTAAEGSNDHMWRPW